MDKEPTEQKISQNEVEDAQAIIRQLFDHPEEIGLAADSPGLKPSENPDGEARGGDIAIQRSGIALEAKRHWHFDETLLEPKWVELLSVTADPGGNIARSSIIISGERVDVADYRDSQDDTKSIRGGRPTKEGLDMALYVVGLVKEELQPKPNSAS